MTPREFHPAMPDEVYDMWLAPIVAEYGWPFTSADDRTEGTKWFYVLGKLPLRDWLRFTWHLEEIDLTRVTLSASTRMVIVSLIQRCVEKRATIVESVAGSDERFAACADYIRANAKIPAQVVTIVRNRQIEVVDGNHRIAALLHVGIPKGYKIPVWLPKPN